MSDRWWSKSEWNDADADADDTGTHRCRACGHTTRIETPQRRTEHYCTACESWRRFTSVLDDPA